MAPSFRGISTAACSLAAVTVPVSARSLPVEEAAHFPARVLNAHNTTRAAVGVPPLEWDRQLGSEAAKYALELAISDMFAHSAPQSRRNAGENLWMGTRSAFTVDTMVANWVSEKSLFQPGVFPAVSRTGSWRDVGHYTQIVWPGTKRVGCALATNARNDYLVCRYWPAGNVHGVAVRPASVAIARRK